MAAPIPDYQLAIPGLGHPRLATAMAGAVGTLVVFGVGIGLARGLSRGKPDRTDPLDD